MPKSNYPEWVMKYKSKGVYVNKVGDKYYLYRAHCVYDKKTKKNVRVSDGYIGRVTEEDGFIPVKDKVTGDVLVYDLGLYWFLSTLLKDVYKSLRKNKNRDTVLSLSIMKSLDDYHYESSALFTIYKNTNPDLFDDNDIISEADRVCSMLNHFVSTRVETDDWLYLKDNLPSIHLAVINNKNYVSSYSDELKNMLKKYNAEVKING
ncbi:MAG: hypothetical protein LUG46_04535 [Erysipelotrichaceae bacterium]|nr:hypothetical protein [Erysipelotrichaceae bacterium]